MLVPQKCQYALRAIFELAKRYGRGLTKTSEIAKAQAIPVRFLEVILSELKRGDFVDSRRGKDGGHSLAKEPQRITVGDVMRYVQGPIGPVTCVDEGTQAECPLHGDCVFLPMWERAQKAMAEVYDGTTFADLVRQEREGIGRYVPSYTI